MSVEGQTRPTYKGQPVSIEETETHRGETMHKVQSESGDEGWVFEEDLDGVDR